VRYTDGSLLALSALGAGRTNWARRASFASWPWRTLRSRPGRQRDHRDGSRDGHTCRISAPLGETRTLRSHVCCGQAATIVKSSKHLAQTSTNTFPLRPRGYDVRACRGQRLALLMCSFSLPSLWVSERSPWGSPWTSSCSALLSSFLLLGITSRSLWGACGTRSASLTSEQLAEGQGACSRALGGRSRVPGSARRTTGAAPGHLNERGREFSAASIPQC
jgi:hypothetical protein